MVNTTLSRHSDPTAPTTSVLFLGGTRSGKSALAESMTASIAESTGAPVTYVATGPGADPSMADRIAAHQVRRPSTWATEEVGVALAPALDTIVGVALVDSLGTWVAAHHDFEIDLDEMIAALYRRFERGQPTILVSDEVGMGVHPATELGNRFRDVLGEVNAAVALAVDEARLVVAGRVLLLHRPD